MDKYDGLLYEWVRITSMDLDNICEVIFFDKRKSGCH